MVHSDTATIMTTTEGSYARVESEEGPYDSYRGETLVAIVTDEANKLRTTYVYGSDGLATVFPDAGSALELAPIYVSELGTGWFIALEEPLPLPLPDYVLNPYRPEYN